MKKRIFRIAVICIALVIGATAAINIYMCAKESDRILSLEEAAQLTDVDYIIVLGAKVNKNGSPSHMLEDRIKSGVYVYQSGVCETLLMSGDSHLPGYDEISCMCDYAIGMGVDTEDIAADKYGLSTYDSMYRLKEIFNGKKVIVITQKYHLYRALYILDALGIEGYGVSADLRPYASQLKQDAREYLARVKEFLNVMIMPEAEYMIKSE